VDRVSFLKGQSREILHFSLLVGLSKMYDTLSAETYGFIFKVCLLCLKVINIFLLDSMKMVFFLSKCASFYPNPLAISSSNLIEFSKPLVLSRKGF
jgi:hypothetical protein